MPSRIEIITAKNGQTLRDYAESTKMLDDESRIAYFPETQLSPAEQQEWLYGNEAKYDIVITFSAFILSDAEKITILDDDPEDPSYIKHGDSINKITMNLWTSMTIGSIAVDTFEAYRSIVENTTNKKELKNILNKMNQELGDSIEKTFASCYIIDKMEKK